jgi:hypothetical protein
MKLFSRSMGDPSYGFAAWAPGGPVHQEDGLDPRFSMLAETKQLGMD